MYGGPIRLCLNHPIAFESISATTIRQTIERMSGSAGPSGLELVPGKECVCHSINPPANFVTIVLLCKRLCTQYFDPDGTKTLVACRLIALDKCPGVRPIGVGECLRRLIGRAVIQCTKEDLLRVIGDQQLCVSHMSGCEPAIHALTDIF